MEKFKFNDFMKKEKVVSAADLLPIFENRMAISRASKNGAFTSIGGGFYSHKDLSCTEATILIVGKYYSDAVVSGLAGLVIHGFDISSLGPVQVDIASTQSIKNKLFIARRVSPTRLHGVTSKTYLNQIVRVYELERCLCEAFRETGQEKSKAWRQVAEQLPSPDALNMDKLAEYDRLLKTNLVGLMGKMIKKNPKKAETRSERSVQSRILQAALTLFAEYGADGVTIRRVADEAGVVSGVITHYFGGKSDLMKAMMGYYHAKVEANEVPAFKRVEKDSIKFVGGFVQQQLKYKDSSRFDYRVETWLVANQEAFVGELARTQYSEMIKDFAARIQAEVPHITASEALGRATFIVAQADMYGHVKWFYSNWLDLDISQSKLLKEYRETLLKVVIPKLFE